MFPTTKPARSRNYVKLPPAEMFRHFAVSFLAFLPSCSLFYTPFENKYRYTPHPLSSHTISLPLSHAACCLLVCVTARNTYHKPVDHGPLLLCVTSDPGSRPSAVKGGGFTTAPGVRRPAGRAERGGRRTPRRSSGAHRRVIHLIQSDRGTISLIGVYRCCATQQCQQRVWWRDLVGQGKVSFGDIRD